MVLLVAVLRLGAPPMVLAVHGHGTSFGTSSAQDAHGDVGDPPVGISFRFHPLFYLSCVLHGISSPSRVAIVPSSFPSCCDFAVFLSSFFPFHPPCANGK